jgi:hypothetical protein
MDRQYDTSSSATLQLNQMDSDRSNGRGPRWCSRYCDGYDRKQISDRTAGMLSDAAEKAMLAFLATPGVEDGNRDIRPSSCDK